MEASRRKPAFQHTTPVMNEIRPKKPTPVPAVQSLRRYHSFAGGLGDQPLLPTRREVKIRMEPHQKPKQSLLGKRERSESKSVTVVELLRDKRDEMEKLKRRERKEQRKESMNEFLWDMRAKQRK